MDLAAKTYCTRCGRTDDDIGTCGSIVTPCPAPAAIDPEKVAIISIAADKPLVAIPVAVLVRGRLGDFAREIGTDAASQARLLFPQATEAAKPVTKSKPATKGN